jgi:NAD(P)-dependent dehydrogenase (short-subunit alcohol dehydrogenase family)
MSQQSVIVTGASGGLGAAIAYQLGRLGADVVITARRADLLEATASHIRDTGAQVRTVPGDITDPDLVKELVAGAVKDFGRLDGIVNNAGILDPLSTATDSKIEDWRRTFEVNLFAPLTLVQAALPHLRNAENYGRVVNISSGASVKGYPTWGAYGASKAALNHLTMTISAEEPNVITVAMRPGKVNTAMQQKIREEGKGVMPEVLYEKFKDAYESGELLDPARPGYAAAVLALYTPPDWSGEYLNWEDEYVRRLGERSEPGVSASGESGESEEETA